MNQRRTSGARPPARPAGTSTAVTIVLVVVTALLGLFVLNRISDDSSNAGSGNGSDTTDEPSDSSLDTTSTTAAPAVDMAVAKVLVANGADVKGLAGSATDALKAAFPAATYLAATDANAKYQASAVYYQAGLEAQAGEIATSLGLTPSGLFPPALPLADPAKVADANILVLLGADKAGGVTVTPPVGAGEVTETTASSVPTT